MGVNYSNEINIKISLLRSACFETGAACAPESTDIFSIQKGMEKIITIERDLSQLLSNMEKENARLRQEAAKAEELKYLMDKCGFVIISDSVGNKGFRNGSIDYFPRAVLDK